MDSDELFMLLSCLCEPKKVDYAVIAADEFDDLSFNKFPLFVIFNESPRSSNGTHWCVALFQKKHHGIKCLLFDSYGVSITHKEIKFNYAVCEENLRQLQSDISNVCGMWCLFWVHAQLNNKSTKNMTTLFSSNLEENDKIVSRFGNRLRRCCKCQMKATGKKLGCVPRVQN